MQRAQCGGCAAHAQIRLECCAPEPCAVPGKHAAQAEMEGALAQRRARPYAGIAPAYLGDQRGAMPVIGWVAMAAFKKYLLP